MKLRYILFGLALLIGCYIATHRASASVQYGQLDNPIEWKTTDYVCMSKCAQQGYSYGYCQSICSYEN